MATPSKESAIPSQNSTTPSLEVITFTNGCSGTAPANCLLCGREAGSGTDSSAIAAKDIEASKHERRHEGQINPEGAGGARVPAKQLCCEARKTSPTASTLAQDNEPQVYLYTPVHEGQRGIRLLSLDPGTPSSPIVGRLIHTSLGSSDQPSYEALSYTWADESGDRAYSGQVWCSTGYLPVTKNGEALLRRVRLRTKHRLVWMDQLCINQSDIPERGQQVGLMPEIYGNASQVLIYLGSASIVDEILPTLRSDVVKDRSFRESQRCRSLLDISWFARVWVLQEALRARKAVMLGDTSCSGFGTVQRLFKFGHMMGGYGGKESLPGALTIEPINLVPATRLLELLEKTNSCCATDPRDKVFALFGMVDSAQEHGLIADYNKTEGEVHRDIALHIIKSSRRLDLLAYFSGDENGLSLPSWVPDWSTRCREPLIKSVKHFLNSKRLNRLLQENEAMELHFSDSGNILVRGRYLTSVRSRWETRVDGKLPDWCTKCPGGPLWCFYARKALEIGAEAFLTGNEPAFGAKEIHDGDQIWHLDGAEQLFALRKNQKNQNAFKVIGECFLFGVLPHFRFSESDCQHCTPYERIEAQEVELC